VILTIVALVAVVSFLGYLLQRWMAIQLLKHASRRNREGSLVSTHWAFTERFLGLPDSQPTSQQPAGDNWSHRSVLTSSLNLVATWSLVLAAVEAYLQHEISHSSLPSLFLVASALAGLTVIISGIPKAEWVNRWRRFAVLVQALLLLISAAIFGVSILYAHPGTPDIIVVSLGGLLALTSLIPVIVSVPRGVSSSRPG
jgi:hypothetical protein